LDVRGKLAVLRSGDVSSLLPLHLGSTLQARRISTGSFIEYLRGTERSIQVRGIRCWIDIHGKLTPYPIGDFILLHFAIPRGEWNEGLREFLGVSLGDHEDENKSMNKILHSN
jgi:hypothetical protein